MPLSDRDYMRNPPSERRPVRFRSSFNFSLNPIFVIIIVNFLFFIVSSISRDAFNQLGLIPIIFWEQPWSLITSMFVHANFWHIFVNMLMLYFFGSYVSRLVGSGTCMLVYFGGGLLGNILYLLLGEPLSIAVGASGAVYALAGTLVVMMPNLKVAIWGIIPMPLWVAVLVFMVLFSFLPHVAWQAHLGGLAVGLIAGYFFRRRGGYYYIR